MECRKNTKLANDYLTLTYEDVGLKNKAKDDIMINRLTLALSSSEFWGKCIGMHRKNKIIAESERGIYLWL